MDFCYLRNMQISKYTLYLLPRLKYTAYHV